MGKILLNNIAEELAAKSNIAINAAEGFLRVFVETIEKGLQGDGIVKVKGLGTFKLIEMGERSSVDVNTGERIVIKGHTKVSFTPDSTMKELVNRPFAHFEPTELNDGFLTEEETIESDDAVDETEYIEEVEVTKEQLKSVEIVIEKVEMIEEVALAEVSTGNSTDEFVEKLVLETKEEISKESIELPNVEPTDVDTVSESQPDDIAPFIQSDVVIDGKSADASDDTTSSYTEKDSKSQAQGKKNHGCVLLIFFLLLCAAVLYYWYTSENQSYQEKKEEHSDIVVNPNLKDELGVEWGEEASMENTLVDSIVTPSEFVTKEESEVVDVGKEEMDTIVTDKIKTDTAKVNISIVKAETSIFAIPEVLAKKELKEISVADTTYYTIVGTLTTHKLKKGETIILLARKYYGDKRLWPYIVKHNRITDFNKVAIGMEVNIPKLCLDED